MIVKTIAAADHQLESRKSDSPTPETTATTRPTSIAEKSYLRSQFERRQRRQIELTNKMNQQQYQQQQQQPDSVIRSHELIKRRFFEELERRESISAARGNACGAIKPGELEQVGTGASSRRHDHQRQPSRRPCELAGGLGDNITKTMPAAKVGAVNEPDGAAALTGTDEVDGASLETIITKSDGAIAAKSSSSAAALYEIAAAAAAVEAQQLPPLVDADIDDGHRRQVDAPHQEAARAGAEQQQAGQQRRASKSADLQKSEPHFANANGDHGVRCEAGQHVESLRGRVVGSEQYANPRSCSRAAALADSSRGSHDDENELRPVEFSDRRPMGNNANHDQANQGGGGEDLICAPLSGCCSDVQVVATGGMQPSGNVEGQRLSVMTTTTTTMMMVVVGSKGPGSASEPDQSIESLQQNADQRTGDMTRPNDSKAQRGGALDRDESRRCDERVIVNCDTSLEEAARKKRQHQQATQSTSPVGRAERILEEDVGSSCSSSGFGASVSANSSSSSTTSSSESSSSHRRHQKRHSNNRQEGHEEEDAQVEAACGRDQLQDDHYRRPTSLRYEPLIGFGGPSVVSGASVHDLRDDEIAQFEIVVGRAPSADALECKSLSVGGAGEGEGEGAYQPSSDHEGHPMLHVENHGYGSLADACQAAQVGQTQRNHRADKRRWPLVDAGKVSSELDQYANRQYVNLPAVDSEPAQSSPLVSLAKAAASARASAGSTVGYAAVRPQSVCAQNSRGRFAGSANIPTTGQNNGHSAATAAAAMTSHERRRQSAAAAASAQVGDDFAHSTTRATRESRAEEDRQSNLSGHNSTTSSANTGGFSKLPPVRLIDHHFASNGSQSSKAPLGRELAATAAPLQMTGFNNCAPTSTRRHEAESNSMQQSKKSPSLLKRFGSLVSRAFTTSNSATSSGGGGGGGDVVVVVDGGRCNASNPSGGHYGARSHATTTGAESNYAPTSESRFRATLQAKRPNTLELENCISNSPGEHKSIENATGVFRAPPGLAAGERANSVAEPSAGDRRHSPADGLVKQAAKKQRHIMAQADLVILSTKNSRVNNQATITAAATTTMRAKIGAAFNTDNCHDARHHCSRRTRTSDNNHNSHARNTRSSHHANKDDKSKFSGAHRMRRNQHTRRSLSSTRSSSITSLDDSSLYSSSQDLAATRRWSRRQNPERRLQRTSSLSEELESLMSRSEVGSRHLCSDDRGDKRADQATRRHSLAATRDDNIHVGSRELEAERGPPSSVAKSGAPKAHRSLMRWFSASGSASSSPAPKDERRSVEYDPNGWSSSAEEARAGTSSDRRGQESRPIDRSHASGSSGIRLDRGIALRASTRRLHRRSSKQELLGAQQQQQQQQPDSLVYASLQLQSNRLDELSKQRKRLEKTSSSPDDDDDNASKLDNGNDELMAGDGGKCQSLNLYQNLLRNYVRRRRDHGHNHHHGHHHHHHKSHHRSHHHHHHHHSHHNHHHGKHSSSARHAHPSTAPRCGQPGSSVDGTCSCAHSTTGGGGGGGKSIQADRPASGSVWGQLIEINKTDGSQVMELERAPGRSWGFFVARGAINNKKGIFISRMHDNAAGSSLSGLLSIGDQIVSIDGHTLEPDFDILRVNQIISKKSKISLGVKPFKG